MSQLKATTFSERLFIEFSQYFKPYTRRLGIPESIFHEFNVEIESQKYNDLFEAASQKQPSLGLIIGREVRAEYFGVFGYSIKNAATVRELIENLKRYIVVYTQGAQFECEFHSEYFVIENIVNRLDQYSLQTVEFIFSSIVTVISKYLGHPVNVKKVSFFHEKPAMTTLHKEIFACPIKFGQSSSKIYLESSILGLKSVDSDPSLFQAILPYLERMRAIRELNELEVKLDYIIKSDLATGSISIERTSQKLGMSIRTLQRQLRHLNLNFGEIVTSVRKEKALNYIEMESYSITQIAQFLGFRESSSFSRAFRRWYGISPQKYINNLKSVD